MLTMRFAKLIGFAIGIMAFQATFAANYFVRFVSDARERGEVSVQFGDHSFGPRLVTRSAPSYFGPLSSALPAQATARWRFGQGAELTESFDLRSGTPSSFDAVVFRLTADGRLKFAFTRRVGGFRDLEIPLNETPDARKLRELNEALYRAAGLGQLQGVKNAVAEGADVNYLFDTNYPSSVRLAANGGHAEVVDFLISKGARIGKRDLVTPYLKERAEALGMEVK